MKIVEINEEDRSVKAARAVGWQAWIIDGRAWWTWRDTEGKLHGIAPVIEWNPEFNFDHLFALIGFAQKAGYRLAFNTTCDFGLYDVHIGDATEDFEIRVFEPLGKAVCELIAGHCKTVAVERRVR